MKTRHGALTAPLILMSLAAAPLPAIAQDRETRPLTGFNAVEVGGGIDLFLRQGDVFTVEVEAEDGDVAEIVTELRDRTLEIHRKGSFTSFFDWGDGDGSVHVTLPALVALTASGGSDVTTEGTFSSDSVRLTASGGSDLTIDVAAGSLEAEASGGSDMRLSGSARSARVQSSGGSDLNASRLTADSVDVHSSGGSDLSIAVRDKIVGDASGGSDISYTGNPQTVDVDTSGGADVRRR
jgi:Putative auto-transporter adhesin, head GIN domain